MLTNKEESDQKKNYNFPLQVVLKKCFVFKSGSELFCLYWSTDLNNKCESLPNINKSLILVPSLGENK